MLMAFSIDEIKNFPSLIDYSQMLTQLAYEDFSNLTISEIEKRIYDLCIVLPSICGKANPEDLNKIHFYRARMQSTIGSNEDLTLVQTYSYPPSSVCSRNGRANLKYTSVFYCSDSPLASILECDPEVGEIGYLTLWKPKAKRQLKYGTYLSEDLVEHNELASLAKKAFAYYKQQHLNTPLGAQMILLRQFLADRFVVESPPYNITSYIANQALYREFNNDFIIYPSSKTFSYYNNYAFHPNSVNENLDFKKVLKFKVLEKGNHIFKIGYMAIGELNPIVINWSIPTDENISDFRLGLDILPQHNDNL